MSEHNNTDECSAPATAPVDAGVTDEWLEQLQAHADEGPIGEAAARDLLREVVRLRTEVTALTTRAERAEIDLEHCRQYMNHAATG